MTALFELYCLGPPRLVSPAGEEVRIRVRKHLALLVFLAVEAGRLHRRDRLIELLWPDATQQAGRGSLATALSLLRGRLGRDAIESDQYKVRLVAGRVRLDLERLTGGDVLGDDFTPPLDVAGFLEGFEMPSMPPEFALWRDRRHASLLPDIKAALIRLADFARRTADLQRLGQCADRLLGIDDLAEEGVRARMETAALTGDRLTAIRVYDEWAERLNRELGATPPALLEGMALRLRRRGWERPATSPIPTVRTEQWRDRPFVGRKREYRVLYETWERVAQGNTRHILLFGDSGVGKTTLADRLATAAGLEGATVSRVRCFELERGIPFAMIGGALTTLLDRPGAAATSPAALAELGRLIPEVQVRYADLPAPGEAQGESARIRFAEAALELLQALMEEHPVVLIVDDFQLADEASLSVLHFLMRRVRDQPFMVIMVSREEQPEATTYAARIRDSAVALGIVPFELSPMSPEESAVLLATLLGQMTSRPTATERKVLLRAAGGYPMALELLVRDWEENGAESLALSLGAMTADVSGKAEQTYSQLSESINRALDPTTRTVLQMAAILDRRLNDLSMYALLDLTLGQTMACLAELVHRRALRDAGQGLEFVNPGLRATTYVSIPPSFRKVLHERIAGRLLDRLRTGEAIAGLEIAWHCVRGGRVGEVSSHLLRGCKEALLRGAPHEAELALKSGAGFLKGSDRAHGLTILAEVLLDLGSPEESIAVLNSLEDLPLELEARSRVLRATARARMNRFSQGDEIAILGELCTLAEDQRVPLETRLDSCRTAASLAARTDNEDVLSNLQSAVCNIEIDSQSIEIRSKALITKGMVCYSLGERAEALKALQAAEEMLDSVYPEAPLLAFVRIGQGAVFSGWGDYRASQAVLERALEVAGGLDQVDLQIQALANLSLTSLRLGCYEETVALSDRCITLIGNGHYPGFTLQAVYCGSMACAMLGNEQSALDRSHVLIEPPSVANYDGLSRASGLLRSDILYAVGRHKAAVSFSRTIPLHDRWNEPSFRRFLGPIARWKTRILLSDGKAEEATSFLDSLWAEVPRMDTLDMAELAAASEAFPAVFDRHPSKLRTVLDRIRILPEPVFDQLSRLGYRVTRALHSPGAP